jgi:hypothetical protein
MKLLIPILALFSILTVPIGLRAKVSVGTLEGTVVDPSGKAVAGASVTIQTSDGRHPHATHTDASGHFAFTRFATGQYDLRAYSRDSYSDWAKRISLHSNKPTQIILRIAPKPSGY